MLAGVCTCAQMSNTCRAAMLLLPRRDIQKFISQIRENRKNSLVSPAASSPLSQGNSSVVTFARLSLAISLAWGEPESSHQYITSKLRCAEHSRTIFQAI